SSKRDWSSDVCSSDLATSQPLHACDRRRPPGIRISLRSCGEAEEASGTVHVRGHRLEELLDGVEAQRGPHVPDEVDGDPLPVERSEERRVGYGGRWRL